eukprot:1586509-Rhodomonas_salina.3
MAVVSTRRRDELELRLRGVLLGNGFSPARLGGFGKCADVRWKLAAPYYQKGPAGVKLRAKNSGR